MLLDDSEGEALKSVLFVIDSSLQGVMFLGMLVLTKEFQTPKEDERGSMISFQTI